MRNLTGVPNNPLGECIIINNNKKMKNTEITYMYLIDLFIMVLGGLNS